MQVNLSLGVSVCYQLNCQEDFDNHKYFFVTFSLVRHWMNRADK